MRAILPLMVLSMLLAACNLPATEAPSTPIALPSLAPPPTSASGEATTAPTDTTPTATAGAGEATTLPDPNSAQWTALQAVFQSPTDIQFPDDGSGRMFVTEQVGRIRIVKDGQMLAAPFLDINQNVGSSGNEQGLLGLAFHPDFKDNPYLYINYTDTQGHTVIARYQANGDQADPASEKVLIHQEQPFPNHNGGVLTFGPDGYLYAGLGDGGSAGDPFGNAQNLSVLLGKVLRIDVDHGDPFTVPADNPFGSPVWEYGLRNPWRISFDKANGDLYIADVGQDTWEEINYVPKGQGGLNFGWSYREASHAYKGSPPATEHLTYPVDEYSHGGGRCSITGGYVYRGRMAQWQGVYLYGDYCSGEIWGMIRSNDPAAKTGWQSQLLFTVQGHITTFGQDPAGEVYYATRGGSILRLEPRP